MKEFFDERTGRKMLALIVCGIFYKKDKYLVYSIKRDDMESNIFLSKLVKTSDGYCISYDFKNGEKEVMEQVVRRVLSKEESITLRNDGFTIVGDIDLASENTFDSKKCYVSTVIKKIVKDCMIYYDFVTEENFRIPVVQMEKEKKINAGFVSNILLIVFGIGVIIFSISVVISVFVR